MLSPFNLIVEPGHHRFFDRGEVRQMVINLGNQRPWRGESHKVRTFSVISGLGRTLPHAQSDSTRIRKCFTVPPGREGGTDLIRSHAVLAREHKVMTACASH